MSTSEFTYPDWFLDEPENQDSADWLDWHAAKNQWIYDHWDEIYGDHSAVADPGDDHEDTGVCSDESMYMPHAQALVLDYSNEVGSKFWARGRKQWKRFLDRSFGDPVSMAQFIATTYGLFRMNMDIYAWRRVRRTYEALNSGRVPDKSTPMMIRAFKSMISTASGRRVRRRLF